MMQMRFNRSVIGLLLFFLAFTTTFSLNAQEVAEIKSVKSIYNREDQSKLKLVSESFKFQLFLDQSKLNISNSLTADQVMQLATAGNIPAFQPNKLKRQVTDNEIRVMSRQSLPEEFTLGGVRYHKIELELGQENGKQVITEAFVTGSTEEDIAKAATTLNFQWSSLGIDKTCKNPVCIRIKVLEDGSEICITIKCNG